jgi:hypothetical protein
VVNDVSEDEDVRGVVSIVICLERAPEVDVMIGDAEANSIGDLPLYPSC